MRQAEKRRRRNVKVKTRIRRIRVKVLAGAPTPEAARELYRAYCSELDKAVKKGVIKKNTAIRRKARAAARLRRSLASPPAASAAQTPAPEATNA